MAGRFNSKFKKRTSHNTSNIKTASSPTVSKPPPRTIVSRPPPVRTTPHGSTLTSNISSTLSRIPSLDVVLPKAEADLGLDDYYDPNVALADDDTKFTEQPSDQYNDVSADASQDELRIDPSINNLISYRQFIGDDIKKDDIVSAGFGGFSGDNNLIKNISDWWTDVWTQPYDPIEAAAADDNTDGQADPLAVYAQENPFTDGEDLPHATKNTIADAVIPAYTDEDGKKVDKKTVPYSDFAPGYHGGEVKFADKTGAEIGIIKDYVTGEQRKSYYHPGSVSAEDHQAALDRQAVGQYQNYIQKDYFNQITSGNMNDDMMIGLHNKIESSALPAAFKQEIWGEYDTKRTDYRSNSTYGGYEGLGSNTTHKTGKVDGVQASNWDFGDITPINPNKAETTKAQIDKDLTPLSVKKKDYANYLVSTGQNIKPGGFDEFYNGTGTGFMDLTKINDKDNKKNKSIWFDYRDLGY